ncbi:hypothetical protein [Streptomyces sp. NPDC001978]|uniref:hypothetical protein n=1 Tax=Streptomyces sp. NPDC001978 TaxID=3364627 RepID=UPI0036C8DF2F
MRAIRVAPAALLGAGALALSATVAVADDGGGSSHDVTPYGFHVDPTTIVAGGKVTLLLNRADGCKDIATVSSGIFDTIRIPQGRSSVTATVDADVRAGAAYPVTFNCDGVSGSTNLTIADGRSNLGLEASGDRQPAPVPLAPAPVAQAPAPVPQVPEPVQQAPAPVPQVPEPVQQVPEPVQQDPAPIQQVPRAVQAGEGGSLAGFDLREIGLGAALVAGSVGAAYRFACGRGGEGDA